VARLRKNPVGLRPLWVFLSVTFFCARETLQVSFIGRKKPSFTTGTLGEMWAKFKWKYMEKMVDRRKKKGYIIK
jgi:hypothetical protein